MANTMVRFDGEAGAYSFLRACANVADAFEFELESIVVATLGNVVTF
jgi:hypothetical protein